MGASTITNVTIDKKTATPSRRGFGVPAILAYHNFWPQRARAFLKDSWTAELTSLSVPVSHPVYRGLSAAFSQNPSPPAVVVGKRSGFTQIVKLTPLVNTDGYRYDFDVVRADGTVVPIQYTVNSDTLAEVGTALAALMDPIAGVASASVAGVITNTSDANVVIGYRRLPDLAEMTVEDTTVAGTTTADLNAFKVDAYKRKISWYGLALDRASNAENAAAAAWAESEVAFFVARTSDSEVADNGITDDIASVVKNATYANTTVFFAQNATDDHRDMAFFGRMLSKTPGSATGAFKTLTGILSDTLTASQEANIQAKYATTYTEINSRNLTFESKTGDGDFFDVTWGLHALMAAIQEADLAAKMQADKLPMTQDGINVVCQATQSVLDYYARPDVRVLAPDPSPPVVNVPKIADVPQADRQARNIPYTWSGRLAGGIHKSQIAGVVGV